MFKFKKDSEQHKAFVARATIALAEITAKPLYEGEVFKLPVFAYKPIENSFGLMTRSGDKAKVTSINWEGCRDRFQNVTENEAVEDFLFFHAADVGDHVIAFVRMTEQIIMATPNSTFKEEDRVQFRKTNNKHILYVKFSKWWKYAVRRSFLTAILRVGQQFTSRTVPSYEKSMFSQYYLASTKPAVNAFLSGRTGCRLKKRTRQAFPGWYNHFNGKDEEKVRETLVRILPEDHPKKKKPEPPPGAAVDVSVVPAQVPVVSAAV
jgi:hypothetical protein